MIIPIGPSDCKSSNPFCKPSKMVATLSDSKPLDLKASDTTVQGILKMIHMIPIPHFDQGLKVGEKNRISCLNIAKLSPAPASAGLRLALFPFDPATHPPTYRDSSFEPTKTTIAA